MATQDSRIKIKRSTITGTVPTVPSSNDHTDGTWIATDIYKGELFYNQADGVLWTRGDSGIECIQGTAKLTIASADVLQLNSTPLTIVSAQGAGTLIEVISASASIDFNTTAYTTNTALQLSLGGDAILGQIGTNFLASTVSKTTSSFTRQSATAGQTQSLENSALIVTNSVGDPTAGDSDITVYVTYRIITL
jgi:hypothetical protein